MRHTRRMVADPALTPATAQAPTPAAPAAADADAWAERRLAILSELAEAGLEAALALKTRIVATATLDVDPACPSASAGVCASACADLARAFDRASRATRLAIALRERVLKEAAEAAASARPETPQAARARQADRVRRIVRRVIAGRYGEGMHREVLDRQAAEKLFDADITGDLAGRPLGALVAAICADLGLPAPWRALAEEAWAQAEIAERPPGSPYEAWPDLPPQDLKAEDLEPDDDDDDTAWDADAPDDWDDPGGGGRAAAVGRSP